MLHLTNSIKGLLDASDHIERDAPDANLLNQVIASGIVRPRENEILGYWFARYLSVRQSLWEVINSVVDGSEKPLHKLSELEDWRYFLIGYSAACLLIRNDRLMLFKVATHKLIQRKLNEEFKEYRIPRKQYTDIYAAYVNTRDAMRIYLAMRTANRNRQILEDLCSDEKIGFIARRLPELESYLDPSRKNYLFWLNAYVSHKWRRKGVVAKTNSLAKVVEGVGRVASEISLHDNKRVKKGILDEVSALLKPGDIIITRHDIALTNLFLPGFWPHAAFYLGTEVERESLGLNLDDETRGKLAESKCVLEARKDGVLFRTLQDTFAVDNFAVVRPALADTDLCRAIERVVRHEGKLYNFDFDFFNSDRLVCTEVVYRALDGIGDICFPLSERAGRKTLSAEDILDYSLSSSVLQPIAVFGVDGCEGGVVSGNEVRSILALSYGSVVATSE